MEIERWIYDVKNVDWRETVIMLGRTIETHNVSAVQPCVHLASFFHAGNRSAKPTFRKWYSRVYRLENLPGANVSWISQISGIWLLWSNNLRETDFLLFIETASSVRRHMYVRTCVCVCVFIDDKRANRTWEIFLFGKESRTLDISLWYLNNELKLK